MGSGSDVSMIAFLYGTLVGLVLGNVLYYLLERIDK